LSILASCEDRIDGMVAGKALALETTASAGLFGKVDLITDWTLSAVGRAF
jgi:hypothetical protein